MFVSMQPSVLWMTTWEEVEEEMEKEEEGGKLGQIMNRVGAV